MTFMYRAIEHLYNVLEEVPHLPPVSIASVLQTYLRSLGPFAPSPATSQQMIREIFDMIELPWTFEIARATSIDPPMPTRPQGPQQSAVQRPQQDLPQGALRRPQQGAVQRPQQGLPQIFNWDELMDDRKNKVLSEELYTQHCPQVECPNSEDTCCMCTEKLAEGSCVRINACEHIFHHECLHRWLTQEKNSCPLCRKHVCEEYVLVDNRRSEFSQAPSPPSSPRVSVQFIDLSGPHPMNLGSIVLSVLMNTLSN